MVLTKPLALLATEVAELDRAGCIEQLRLIQQPRLDFTDEYLERTSTEGLRHILMAAIIQNRKHLVAA